MRIVAHRPQRWFLAEEDGALFLDANCSNGPAAFSVLARLTPAEAADYASAGDASLDRLAQAIQDHGPDSFGERDVGRELGARFHATVMAWLAEQQR